MNRMVAAYHEAGHAVADITQGIKVKSVSIVADEFTAGRSDGYVRSRAFRDAFAKVDGECHAHKQSR